MRKPVSFVAQVAQANHQAQIASPVKEWAFGRSTKADLFAPQAIRGQAPRFSTAQLSLALADGKPFKRKEEQSSAEPNLQATKQQSRSLGTRHHIVLDHYNRLKRSFLPPTLRPSDVVRRAFRVTAVRYSARFPLSCLASSTLVTGLLFTTFATKLDSFLFLSHTRPPPVVLPSSPARTRTTNAQDRKRTRWESLQMCRFACLATDA